MARIHDFQAGQFYRGDGPGTWEVIRVSKKPASIFGDEYTKTRSARGTVVLYNDKMDWELVAPVDHKDLAVLSLIQGADGLLR